MGTTQILYGLAKKQDWYSKYMGNVGLIAPCTVTGWSQWIWYNLPFMAMFWDLKIPVIVGPNWETDKKKIEDRFGSLIADSIQGAFGHLPNVSLKTLEHYAQNA